VAPEPSLVSEVEASARPPPPPLFPPPPPTPPPPPVPPPVLPPPARCDIAFLSASPLKVKKKERNKERKHPLLSAPFSDQPPSRQPGAFATAAASNRSSWNEEKPAVEERSRG